MLCYYTSGLDTDSELVNKAIEDSQITKTVENYLAENDKG